MTLQSLSIWDFRKGLDEYSTVEKSAPDVATVSKNCRYLPRGWIAKRPQLKWYTTVGIGSVDIHGLIENESQDHIEIVNNYHFDSFTGGVPDNWTVDANASTAQVSNEHTVRITQSSGTWNGIRQDIPQNITLNTIPTSISTGSSNAAKNVIYRIQMSYTLTSGKDAKVQMKDMDGTVKGTTTLSGTGSAATLDETFNLSTGSVSHTDGS